MSLTVRVPVVVAPGAEYVTNTAQAQSTALGMPLSKVQITVSYGIKFEGNVGVSVPISLVTIGGNGDYNRNNTQTITLTFGG